MISLKERKQQGFTIVELLIVIVVIGILAGLVITTYNGIQQKARNTERTTDLKTFQSQLEAYYANIGYYPSSADLGSTGSSNITFIQANMKGMDKETLRDPSVTAGTDQAGYGLANSVPSAVGKYAYVPSPADCTDSGTTCTSYKLYAWPEGGSAPIEYDSLN